METTILILLLLIDIGLGVGAIVTGSIGLAKKNLVCAIVATVLGGIAMICIFFISWLTLIAGIIGLALGIPGIVLAVKK